MMGVNGAGTGGGDYWGSALQKQVNQTLNQATVAANKAMADRASGAATTKAPDKTAATDSSQMLMDMLAKSLQGQAQIQTQNAATNAAIDKPSPTDGSHLDKTSLLTHLEQVVMQTFVILQVLKMLPAMTGAADVQADVSPSGNPPATPGSDDDQPATTGTTTGTTSGSTTGSTASGTTTGTGSTANTAATAGIRSDQYADLIVAEALRMQTGETDPDGDGMAISQDDLDWMKQLLDQKKLTPEQLAGALKKQFAKPTSAASDELAVLMAQSVDQGVLPARQFLDKAFLNGLGATHMDQLGEAFANMGVSRQDGKPLTHWMGWLLLNSGDTTSPEGKFAGKVLDKMPAAWNQYWDTAEGGRVKSFLQDFMGVTLPAATSTTTARTAPAQTTADAAETTDTATASTSVTDEEADLLDSLRQ